jgi:hypothetical protein
MSCKASDFSEEKTENEVATYGPKEHEVEREMREASRELESGGVRAFMWTVAR